MSEDLIPIDNNFKFESEEDKNPSMFIHEDNELFSKKYKKFSFSQRIIDEIRFRVWLHYLRTHLENPKKDLCKICHIWFPYDEPTSYELRSGNAPSDSDRPKHLKKFKLEIDISFIPNWLREELRPNGAMDKQIENMAHLYDSKHRISDSQIINIRIKLFNHLAKKFAKRGFIYGF